MTHAQWKRGPLCSAAATYCNAPNNEILCKQSPAIKLPRYTTGNRKARAISTLLDNLGQDGINVFLTQDKWNPVVKFRVQSRYRLWINRIDNIDTCHNTTILDIITQCLFYCRYYETFTRAVFGCCSNLLGAPSWAAWEVVISKLVIFLPVSPLTRDSMKMWHNLITLS